MQQNFLVLSISNQWLSMPRHHRRKPDMRQHEEHHKIRSSPNMKPQTRLETKASRSFNNLGSTISPNTKHINMKQCYLWWDFQLQQLSRLRARDVPARCSDNVVSCGVCGPLKKGPVTGARSLFSYKDMQVCSQMFCSLFWCHIYTRGPPPNQQSHGFPLEFVFKEPQTELRTTSAKVANKRNYANGHF